MCCRRRSDRLSADAQGRRRRRRQRHAHGRNRAELPGALRAARSEAGSAFGDSAVYLERRIIKPRHIEVQLLGDQHGTIVPFVERECTIQRRHQKVIEESPSPVVTPELRSRITSAAAAVARAVNYTNAGTIEFLLDENGEFFFLEMNTRLQVEHPITEMVTGVDLVAWQIRIARGERLTLDPERSSRRAHMPSSAESMRRIPTTASSLRLAGSTPSAFRTARASETTAAPMRAAKCRSSTIR